MNGSALTELCIATIIDIRTERSTAANQMAPLTTTKLHPHSYEPTWVQCLAQRHPRHRRAPARPHLPRLRSHGAARRLRGPDGSSVRKEAEEVQGGATHCDWTAVTEKVHLSRGSAQRGGSRCGGTRRHDAATRSAERLRGRGSLARTSDWLGTLCFSAAAASRCRSHERR